MAKMKMWHIPDPWDYHQYGGYIVMASTKEAAINIAKKNEAPHYGGRVPDYDDISEVEGKVYVLSGCDC